jgi:hypothetical protein
VKSKMLFRDDHPRGLVSRRKIPRVGANDNVPSLEFETTGQERDWRLFCLVGAIVCGLSAFIFLPLW